MQRPWGMTRLVAIGGTGSILNTSKPCLARGNATCHAWERLARHKHIMKNMLNHAETTILYRFIMFYPLLIFMTNLIGIGGCHCFGAQSPLLFSSVPLLGRSPHQPWLLPDEENWNRGVIDVANICRICVSRTFNPLMYLYELRQASLETCSTLSIANLTGMYSSHPVCTNHFVCNNHQKQTTVIRLALLR